ncbi:MAG TPA: OmpH family outer membrane protein [Verrucomicrobiae bacterium]|jgi:Skp family chaperone for outer membrane proteins|nr:OmpH family outer membrane protein [Verrucomicrobiae bacterium]
MKTFMQKGILLAAVLGLSLSTVSAQSTGSLKVGVVDLRKVFESYYKKVQTDDAFKKEAENMEKERKDMLDEAKKVDDQYKKLFDSANDQAVSADERAKAKSAAEDKYRELATRKDAIDQYDRQALARLQEEKRQRRDTIVAEIKDHLVAQAKAAGYNLVCDTSGESANMIPVVVYASGVPDLTDALIKELNAGAPSSFTVPVLPATPAH